LKPKKDKRKHASTGRTKGAGARVLLVFLAVISLSCMYIWQRVTVVALANRVKELNQRIQTQHEALKYLQIELTKLGSVERIEEKGKELGLVYPSLDQIEWIRESSDSVYLEKRYPSRGIWAQLSAIQRKLLPAEEAVAREVRHEP
jgi:cell division protein FtsL